jgi:ribosome modulation factor
LRARRDTAMTQKGVDERTMSEQPEGADRRERVSAVVGRRSLVIADRADRGLLMTLLELCQDGGKPSASAAVGEAVGIPEEYLDIVEDRLEQNRQRGLVGRDRSGCWYLTANGRSVATSGWP